MAKQLCKHSRIVPTKADRKRFPLVGFSLRWASLCLVAGLGRGGFGCVYLGEECRDGSNSKVGAAPRLTAVKIVNTRCCTPGFIDSLRSEYKVYSKIKPHPNIIRVFSFHEVLDKAITFLEYAEDGDVHNLLDRYGEIIRRDNSLIKIIYLQVLDAVAHIHKQEIFHCDIKPENFLCKREGGMIRVLLTDFGCSTDESIIYGYGDCYSGTSLYFPPECIPPTLAFFALPRAMDIWALGVFLYNLCSGGYHPWTVASETYDRAYSVYADDPIAFVLRLQLSPAIQDFLLATWAPNPWHRQSLRVSALREQIEPIDVITTYPDAEAVLDSVRVRKEPLLDIAAWQRGRCLKVKKPRQSRRPKTRDNNVGTDKQLHLDLETQEAALLALALSDQLESNAS